MEFKELSTEYIRELEDWFKEPNQANGYIHYYSKPQQWLALVDGKKRCGFAAVINDRMVGFVDIEFHDAQGASFAFGVDPRTRGRGFGKQIVAITEGFVKKRGAVTLYAGVDQNNTVCRQLMERAGYCEVPEGDGTVGYSKSL